jgi:hypothetical protein
MNWYHNHSQRRGLLRSRSVESVGKVIFRKFAINKIKYLRVGKLPKSGFFYRLVRRSQKTCRGIFNEREYSVTIDNGGIE